MVGNCPSGELSGYEQGTITLSKVLHQLLNVFFLFFQNPTKRNVQNFTAINFTLAFFMKTIKHDYCAGMEFSFQYWNILTVRS